MKPLCIYHGNCADGFAAAWVVRKALENVDFHPGTYQNPPPDVTDRDVIIVDFSYKRQVLDQMSWVAKSILILDHHKSAAEELTGLPVPYGRHMTTGIIKALFDMNRSGAGITWDYYFHGQPRPALLNRIEDRDLWRFRYPDTRAINAAVFSYTYDFEVWDRLFETPLEVLEIEGESIERKHCKDIAELIKVTQRTMVIGGAEIPVANLPYTMSSDAGHQMATEHPSQMAACYWDTPEGRVFSLRSTYDGPDVSAIAKTYGGGGHAHAAGFRKEIGWEGESS